MFCTGTLERGVECHDLRCPSHDDLPTAHAIFPEDGGEPVCGYCFGPADAVLQCDRCARVSDEGYGRTRRHAGERCGAKLEYDEAEVDSDSEQQPRVWAKRGHGSGRVVVSSDEDSVELFD